MRELQQSLEAKKYEAAETTADRILKAMGVDPPAIPDPPSARGPE